MTRCDKADMEDGVAAGVTVFPASFELLGGEGEGSPGRFGGRRQVPEVDVPACVPDGDVGLVRRYLNSSDRSRRYC